MLALTHCRRLLLGILLLVLFTGAIRAKAPSASTLFQVEDNAIVSHNGDRYNDRPLYGGADPFFVIAGDRPLVRLIREPYLYNSFIVAYVRGNTAKWLQDCSDVTSQYRPDRMEWIIKDPAFAGTTLDLQAVPLAGARGMAIRFQAHGAQPGDRLIWLTGSGKYIRRVASAFEPYAVTRKMGFVPTDCAGTEVHVDGELFTIRPPAREGITPTPEAPHLTAAGACSVASHPVVTDASLWTQPLNLAHGSASSLPAVTGSLDVTNEQEIFWAIELSPDDKPVLDDLLRSPAQTFATGMDRARKIGTQVVVDTPDSRFNVAVAVSCAAMDAIYAPPTFMHAPMNWRSPYLGWRSLFGSIAYGWHDRVDTDVNYCVNTQITHSSVTTADPDPKFELSMQSQKSVYFKGVGRLKGGPLGYQSNYDMQTEFFDQAIQNWRYTADPKAESILRPALELHLAWIKTCFDPTDSGVYGSYLNTWATDDQWYNGGPTAEETAYAYRGHLAALDMARHAGDAKSIAFHQKELEKIRNGFFKLLWVADQGHSGAYREETGYKRLHEDPWIYSIFLPIDAGLLSTEQAAASIHFALCDYENFPSPTGGETVTSSNWVPAIGTIRNVHSGDEYHLALACFQTGLTDDGWNLLNGTYIPAMLDRNAPGDLAADGNGIDFSDSDNMFCRAVVEGVFGYTPDYPNGIVKLAPQFPQQWDHASIRTPDFSTKFQSGNNTTFYEVDLAKPAAMDIRLPVRAQKVSAVKVNGQKGKWQLLPGFGNSIVRIQIPTSSTAKIEITYTDPLPQYPALSMQVTSGQQLTLTTDDAKVTKIHDGQGALSDPQIRNGQLVAQVSHNVGDHLVLLLVKAGDTPQWRSLKLHITDPAADAQRQARILDKVPPDATWDCLDLSSAFNGDIRTIYQQNYVSPRPNTCALRLSTDGFRTWMMGSLPLPDIDFTGVSTLLKGTQLVTPQGVPFQWSGGGKNIAFTSRWDNWPKTVTIPVKKTGRAIWFLVCGSTNCMQVRIPNAEIRMKYSDGVEEKLSLVPPDNYWSLCSIDHRDYDESVAFSLPKIWPQTVQLGKNCRAMLLNYRLRKGVELESVTLETLSEEVVVGLMGVTVMNTNPSPKG